MNTTRSDPAPRLGTFLGVFTPTVLTILGVILYLRSGWVVAQVGPWGALAIVVLANSITLLTTLSMSALATSMRVGVGGAYFLISRSFGLAVGGAIGLPLYMSQALSVTLYAYGLAEVLRMVWPAAPVPLVAAAVIVAVSAVAARSTELALKLQIPILALIAASIASLYAGVPWDGAFQVPAFGPPDGVGFWSTFAVFFPAVTGILAGVSLSGDLRDPGRAIPIGALGAVLVGFVVYMITPVALALAAPPEVLSQEGAWSTIAWMPALVIPGMVGAILSSAFGSILGAPRTLQALANDGLVPGRLAETDPSTGEPMLALRVTTGIALAAVLLGDLNVVATVLTMFFLTTYGMLNLVAGTEALVADLSYRPRLRIPVWASFLGVVGCLAAMVLVSPVSAMVALLIEALVFWRLRRHALEATWGDVQRGVWYTAARWALDGLNHAREDARSWRPHILLFSADLSRSVHLARFANDFGQQRGIVTVCTLVVGAFDDHQHDLEEQVERNRQLLTARAIAAFPEVAAVPDFESGVMTVAQANGYAGMASNTMLFGWPEDAQGLARLLRLSRRLEVLHKCTVIARLVDSGRAPRKDDRPTAIVWWKGRASNGDLMLLMAWLLSRSEHWHGLRIVLASIVGSEDEAVARREAMAAMIPDLRMDVEFDVLVAPPERTREVLRERSRAASIVFLGLRAVPPEEEEADAASMVELLDGLPSTVLVRNAGPFRGRLV